MFYGLWMQGRLPQWWPDYWPTAATFYFEKGKTVVLPVLNFMIAL